MRNKKINIDDNVNFTYHYWMRKYFGLEGVELTLYALVYNVSCFQNNKLYLSARHMAELIGSSERTVFRTLGRLCEKNLIIKNTEKFMGVERTFYSTNIDLIIKKRYQFSGDAKMHTPIQNNSILRSNI